MGTQTKAVLSLLPRGYDKRDGTQTGGFVSNIYKIISALAQEIDVLSGQPDPIGQDYSSVEQARLSILLGSAAGEYLGAIGSNFGIPRHPLIGPSNDEMYRQLIMLLAWLPKAINFSVLKLLEILLGAQADLVLAGKRPWQVYELVPNEITIEVPYELTRQTLETASYLHGIIGIGSSTPMVAAPTFTVYGRDLTQEWAQTFVGMRLSIYYAAGWHDYTVMSLMYSAPDTMITTTTNIVADLVGARFRLNTIGYRGHFLARDATEHADTSTTPPHSDRVYLQGDGILEIAKFYLARIVRASGIIVRLVRI
jgi:hypothetical protein